MLTRPMAGHSDDEEVVSTKSIHKSPQAWTSKCRKLDVEREKETRQAVQQDGVEGGLAGEPDAHHDHARHPEEEDVVARLHDGGGKMALVVRRILIRPPQRAERPAKITRADESA